MDKVLNVVSLNIPLPANYGGVIDIWHKIKALHNCGVKIILHCFEYERPRTDELLTACDEVYYYRRRTGWRSNFSLLPYNVYSRKDEMLMDNLLKNDYPILFEGLHSCYYITDRRLANRFKIFRECNIEHDYYFSIGNAERNILKKTYFYIEALRFRLYQKAVANAQLTLAISTNDRDYLQGCFPHKHVEYVPCFHGNTQITAPVGKSDFLLYHGKLSVKENERAALYLIKHVFSKMEHRCIIAGMNPSKTLLKAAGKHRNISIIANPSREDIAEYISKAQISVLVTFQGTGLKLKLLNSLFAGRHVVVNSKMLVGSGLDSLCHIADSPKLMISLCNKLYAQPFSLEDRQIREKVLFPAFSDEYQAKRIIEMIWQ